ncbi:MAG: hypothetical protein ACYCX4_12165, partial [Bacillota bacterium]
QVYIQPEDIIGNCGELLRNQPENVRCNWLELLFNREESTDQDLRDRVFTSWSKLTCMVKPRFSCLEQNQTREIFYASLKNYNLHKIGLSVETGEVLINFNFPQVLPEDIYSLLIDLLKQTGWTWRINKETNLEALKSKLLELLPEGVALVKEPSIHREENKVKIKVVSASEPDRHQWQKIMLEFSNGTGWKLEVQTETPTDVKKIPKTPGGKMEINTAFNHIKSRLKAEGVEIYKTSLVGGSIRVQFITPEAAVPHKQVLNQLEEETGYTISIHMEPNSSALFQKIRSILPVKNNPSLFKDRREIKIAVDGPVDEDTRQKLELFSSETGFNVSV